MTFDLDRLPPGWRKLAADLIAKGKAQFGAIRFLDISAKAGWLSIDLDRDSVSVEQHWRALKFCEGYASISWHICSECGGQNATLHSGHTLPLCDECHGSHSPDAD